ncbi:MAG: DUF2971 domain-containing protein [Methylococcales bacterium]|nr:DUF2971 domain-containing protein [Methylococcales bacterium]
MKILRPQIVHRLVCERHGIKDCFPCPWPDCENGLSENCFEEESIIMNDGKPRTIYTRREWVSPFGGSYYTWDSNYLPNWFGTLKTLWNEARRFKLIETEEPPKLIYHYTSLEGFAGIVQNRSLWLSDYSYLNDKHELTYGIDIIREVASEILNLTDKQIVLDLLQAWENNIGQFENRVCIASFSADGDSLSQWRAYGNIALGFKPHDLAMHSNGANLQAIEYDRVKQGKLISICLHHLVQAYEVDYEANRLERIPDVYHKAERLIELIVFFKNSAFYTEREFRLAYVENPEMLQLLEKTLPKKFRITNSKIIPYVSSDQLYVGLGEQSPLVIREVILAPETSDLLERGLKEFLAFHDMNDVVIRRSAIPYRT